MGGCHGEVSDRSFRGPGGGVIGDLATRRVENLSQPWCTPRSTLEQVSVEVGVVGVLRHVGERRAPRLWTPDAIGAATETLSVPV